MQNLDHLRPARLDQPVILVVDDEPIVCNIVRIGLEAEGLFVLSANDGEQALVLSRKFPGTIHAVVSDITMPKLDGVSLVKQLLIERPNIKVLLISGQTDRMLDGIAFLPKPFHIEELKRRMRELFASQA